MASKSNKPQDKKPRTATEATFRIKDDAPKDHWINGRMHHPGDTVSLLPGVLPGKWLEPLNKAAETLTKEAAAVDEAANAKAGARDAAIIALAELSDTAG
jgi:hypothetical protein